MKYEQVQKTRQHHLEQTYEQDFPVDDLWTEEAKALGKVALEHIEECLDD